MLEAASYSAMQRELAARITEDRQLLDMLRDEIRPLRNQVRRIQPRSTTSISLVGTDGGNNKLQFDPFLVHMIRVVDSNNNEYSLEAVTPSTDPQALSARQFTENGKPKTPLGHMMADLGINELHRLSTMIPSPKRSKVSPISPTWVQVYRELVEWATLYWLIKAKEYGSDTLIVADGWLRSKVFASEFFPLLLKKIEDEITRQFTHNRRRIYVAGLFKHSQVLTRYRLAMALENVLRTNHPAFVEVPREIEEKAYLWIESARGADNVIEGGEVNKYVGGKLFLVKFGSMPTDPVWPCDILLSQIPHAQSILGYMLADAENGFPVPFYPQCLQKAHENAALVDFDFDVLQDGVFHAIREALGNEAQTLDSFQLQDQDPAERRYN